MAPSLTAGALVRINQISAAQQRPTRSIPTASNRNQRARHAARKLRRICFSSSHGDTFARNIPGIFASLCVCAQHRRFEHHRPVDEAGNFLGRRCARDVLRPQIQRKAGAASARAIYENPNATDTGAVVQSRWLPLGTVWPHDNSIIAPGVRKYGCDKETCAGSVPFMIESLLGLVPKAFEKRLEIVRPVLPVFVTKMELYGLRVGKAAID